MRQRIMAAFLAMCMICCLTACGGSGTASSAGSGSVSQAGGGTDQTKDTGLFSVEGGWKDSDGNAIFFDAGGKGWALGKVTVPSNGSESDKNSPNIPGMIKTSLTWEESAESATVKILENEVIYQKTRDSGADKLTGNGISFSRLNDSEQKEYAEKAAALQEFGGFASASSGQQAGGTSETGSAGGQKSEDFSDIILYDNDIATIELIKFYEDEVIWGDISNTLMEKYITVKVKNKSDEELYFSLSDGYIHDESVTMSMMDSNQGPAPGKSKTYTFKVYYNLHPDHVPLESLEDLYTLDAAVDIRVKGENSYSDSKPRIVLSEILGGSQGNSLADGSSSDTSSGSSGSGSSQENSTGSSEKDQDAVVTETDYMTIEGLYVDNSYSTEDNENIRFLYVCYTAHTKAENLSIDCKSMKLTVNDVNTYKAARSKKEIRYMRNYYNGAYLKKVNIGDEVKFVETFEIPRAELEPGRSIRISKSQIPDSDKIRLRTDDIVFLDSPEKVAETVDPEGYEKEKWALEDADDEVTSAVKNEINGYQWEVNVDKFKYVIEFWEPNNYELRTSFNTSGGTYVVKNGYIICTNDIGGTIEVPFTYEGGRVKVDSISAFDFKK